MRLRKSTYKIVRLHYLKGLPFENKARVLSQHWTLRGAQKELKDMMKHFRLKTNLKIVYDWQPQGRGKDIIVL